MQPDQEKQSEVPLPPLFAKSQEAFYRNLPALLKTHCRQWVAFHGDACAGFGRTETELYQRCLRQGLKEGEFIVLFADEAALHDQEEVDLPCYP